MRPSALKAPEADWAISDPVGSDGFTSGQCRRLQRMRRHVLSCQLTLLLRHLPAGIRAFPEAVAITHTHASPLPYRKFGHVHPPTTTRVQTTPVLVRILNNRDCDGNYLRSTDSYVA